MVYINAKGKIHYKDGTVENITIYYTNKDKSEIHFCTETVKFIYREWLEYIALPYPYYIAPKHHEFRELKINSDGLIDSVLRNDIDYISTDKDLLQ